MHTDILYTPDEVASILKITKGTVYEMIKRGDLDAHRIGRHLRVSQTQFDLYLLKSSGNANIFEGTITSENNETYVLCDSVKIFVESKLEGSVKLSVKPENIILSKGNFISSARNQLLGKITNISINGNKAMVTLDAGIKIDACVTVKSLNELKLNIGTEVYAIFKTMSIYVYK